MQLDHLTNQLSWKIINSLSSQMKRMRPRVCDRGGKESFPHFSCRDRPFPSQGSVAPYQSNQSPNAMCRSNVSEKCNVILQICQIGLPTSAFLSESPLCCDAGTFCHRIDDVFRLLQRFSQRTRYCVCVAGEFSEVTIFAIFDAGMIVVAETVTESEG